VLGSEDGLLVWDISKPPAPNNILEPIEKLPGHGRSAIVGYNPRTNLLASADKDLLETLALSQPSLFAGLASIDAMISERDNDLVKVHPIDPASIPNFAGDGMTRHGTLRR
jgi:hypothetical protein